MADPIVSGSGTVAVDFEKTLDASEMLKASGDKVKECLDIIKVEYQKNINNPDVWASDAAQNAYNLFDGLQKDFEPAHAKIMTYSEGVKLVVDEYKADQAAQIEEAEENLNGTGTAV